MMRIKDTSAGVVDCFERKLGCLKECFFFYRSLRRALENILRFFGELPVADFDLFFKS